MLRGRTRWLVVGAIGLWLVLATSPAHAQTRTVTGLVSDENGEGIAGAQIDVDGAPELTTLSTDLGAFTIDKAPVGELLLRVTAPDRVPVAVPVPAGRGAMTVSVTLVRKKVEAAATRLVSGLVRDAVSGAPVMGATVTVRGTDLAATTDEDGLFQLVGVKTADVTLDVTFPSDAYEPASVQVAAGDSVAKIALAPTDPLEPGEAPATRAVRGTVVDADTGEPVAGAAVAVVGTSVVAISDETGTFVIDGLPVGEVALDVTAVGFAAERLAVPPRVDEVVATLGLAWAEEIVVEARAPVIVKQHLASGASVVTAAQLAAVPAQTVEVALQGKIAGANLQTNSGAPGGGAQLRLRGISTINGQSSPLFVVDGVIVSNVAVPTGRNAVTAATAGGSRAFQDDPVNRIADLDLADIESVEVLKGASAAALYGSKAANGVVIITTRRARGGPPRVHVTQRFGLASPSNRLGSRRFGSATEVMAAYGAGSPLVAAYTDGGGAAYDHEAAITRSVLATETIASASGGTEQVGYHGSISVRDEPGVVVGTDFARQAGRLGLTFRLFDRLRLAVSAHIIHAASDRGLFNNDNTRASTYMVLSGTPSFVDLRPGAGGAYPVNPAVTSGANPLQSVARFDSDEDVWRVIAGGSAALDVLDHGGSVVRIVANLGLDSFDQKNTILAPAALHFEDDDGLAGTAVDATTTHLGVNLGAGATWAYAPRGGALRSAFAAGLLFDTTELASVYATARGLTAGPGSVDSARSITLEQARQRTRDLGLYLQEEVALLDDDLTLLGGLLAERSSLNGDPSRYYLFPKLAVVYALPTLHPHVDQLRVRGAYGEAGNRPLYGQKFTPLDGSGTIDGEPGLALGDGAGDPAIAPERQRELEVGLDAVAFGQRAVVEVTYYQRVVTDLLLERSLATSTGFTTEVFNGGRMRNRGLELAAQVTPVVAPVDWTARLVFTLNRSRVTDLPDGIEFFDVTAAGFGTGLGANRIEEHKSATQIVGTRDRDGTIGALGDGEPRFRVGLANEVRWRRLTFTSLLDWQQGSHVVNLTRLLYDAGQTSVDFVDDGSTPGVIDSGAERIAAFDRGDIKPYVEDATYLKLREVAVRYELPAAWVAGLGAVDTVHVTLAGRNLWTLTGYSGLDPEVSNFGNQAIGRNYDVAPYPPSRSVWLSVSAEL